MAETGARDVQNHVLFEVATEVANRVGGIYSVLKSKAQVTTAEYGAAYTLLGPWNRASVRAASCIFGSNANPNIGGCRS
jgi:glycogen(starch) synthase